MKLDAAVAAAHGRSADLSDEEILEKLLALNLERAAEEEKSANVTKPKLSRPKQADELKSWCASVVFRKRNAGPTKGTWEMKNVPELDWKRVRPARSRIKLTSLLS